MRREDLTGKRFGKLTALEYSGSTPDGRSLWKCLCDCGMTTLKRAQAMKRGGTQSCGCIVRNMRGENNPRNIKRLRERGVYLSSRDDWYVRASTILSNARKNNIPFGFKDSLEFTIYLKSIAPEVCPVFGVPLTTGKRVLHDWSPSVDKIDKKKGYVRGNIQIISYLANAMKRDASPERLNQFAKWVLSKTDGRME
jgi:hypothetical protein